MSRENQKCVLYDSYYTVGWRVRCILAWKNIEYESRLVDLSESEDLEKYLKVNPSKKIPAFITADGKILTQTLAIMEYIEETYPERPCLPKDPLHRALVREICNEIACDIHPIQNSNLAKEAVGGDKDKFMAWGYTHITRGFDGLEAKLREAKEHHLPGKYCVGDSVTMADFCLMPQFYNAGRYNVDLSRYPIIHSILENLKILPELINASPELSMT